jgi:hypothetical protein
VIVNLSSNFSFREIKTKHPLLQYINAIVAHSMGCCQKHSVKCQCLGSHTCNIFWREWAAGIKLGKIQVKGVVGTQVTGVTSDNIMLPLRKFSNNIKIII